MSTQENISVKRQKGFALSVLVIVVLAVALLGFVGFRVKKKVDTPKTAGQQAIHQAEPSSSILIGVVKFSSGCRYRETVDPCFDQILSTDNGTPYGLTGQDVSAYDGQRVEIQGEVLGSTNPPTLKVDSIKPVAEPTSEPMPKPNNKGFDAQVFYNKIENGLNYQQVKELAGGKEGDCGQTAIYPPSGNMSCTWSDSMLRVTVNISQDKVISKQKVEL